jgi:diguanylate cyclase (GGDEF)-like protein/putative nucleotidyltransferase with HDIG domain
MTLLKKVRVGAVVYIVAGIVAGVLNLSHVNVVDLRRFIIYLVCANTAALVLRLAPVRNLVPAGLIIMMLGIGDLSLPELLFIAFTVTLIGELREFRGGYQLVPMLYSIASITVGISTAHTVYRMTSLMRFNAVFPAPALASAFVLLFNFGLTTTLLKGYSTPFIGVYRRECRSLLPWFIAAAYLAYLVRCAAVETGYHPALIALPILFALDRGYRAWSVEKAEHRRDLEALHLHTLETLAVAIDTRDHTTQMHLRRVQIYATEVGRELGLNETELQSLNIAALLHDIGKLGIPDYILLKPGPLTVEEREKMKTHPEIGADMLLRMKYPESVREIVGGHHEKWDGTGYPKGLRHEEIPIGARILSAVDCLDALSSERPYRGAMTLEEAMEAVRNEKGKSFDPKIISILEHRYLEMEQLVIRAGRIGEPHQALPEQAPQGDLGKLATKLLAESNAMSGSLLKPILSARQETLMLQALASDLSTTLHTDAVLAAVHRRLGELIGYNTLAVYLPNGDHLELVGVAGESSRLFQKRSFPVGDSLSGWAARSGDPIVNGSPAMECCYAEDVTRWRRLQSALAVPFEGRGHLKGVLTLYHLNQDAFTRDDLRIVQAAAAQVGRAIESALKYQFAEESAVTDHLTGVPNARSLAAHLERELSRAQRDKSTVGVLMCDLDGFKGVNDRFGHLKGNEVLQNVANGLRLACRTSDYLARIGGDEFVIVLPGLTDELCAANIERFRAVATEAGWAVCGEQCLSMSIGVATYPIDGGNPETLFEKADRRMYRAKNASKHPEAVLTPVPSE